MWCNYEFYSWENVSQMLKQSCYCPDYYCLSPVSLCLDSIKEKLYCQLCFLQVWSHWGWFIAVFCAVQSCKSSAAQLTSSKYLGNTQQIGSLIGQNRGRGVWRHCASQCRGWKLVSHQQNMLIKFYFHNKLFAGFAGIFFFYLGNKRILLKILDSKAFLGEHFFSLETKHRVT